MIWIITALFFFLIEIGHPALFLALSCSFGSIAGFFASYFELQLWYQCLLACIITFLSFIILHKIGIRLQSNSSYKTSIMQLKGSITTIIDECHENQTGTVRIGGTTWGIIGVNRKRIPAGSLVRIIDIKGIVLIVEPINQ